jgi:hypothetical protein
MASQLNATKAFYTQVGAVVDNLIDMFPDDADFPTFKTFLNLLQHTNPALVINTFHQSIALKFADQIRTRNEKFLIDYTPVEYGSDVTDIVSKIKNYWSVLDAQTKDSLWQYLYILMELSKKAVV